MATLETKIEGKTYRVHLVDVANRPCVWVRVVRQTEAGEVEAFLSSRQHKAEARVRRVFAREIADHTKARAA